MSVLIAGRERGAIGSPHDWPSVVGSRGLRCSPNQALERTATSPDIMTLIWSESTVVAGAGALPVAVAQLGR